MKEIVNILVENGYEAYIVGGYVRDYLLGLKSYDIDICTNASIDKICELFKGKGVAYKEYFAFHIDRDGYSYDITTYRKEGKYKKNKPIEITKAKTLEEDLIRRDFTINTFAMDKNGLLVDKLGAKRDLDSRIIRTVGDANKKLSEDKTRIIRALRFACTLDFELDEDIIDFLSKKKAYMLNEVPNEYIRKELDKIFDSPNYSKFFYLIKKYNIEKYFNLKFDNIIDSYNRYGIWSQIETDLPFSKKEKRIIYSIKDIVNRNNITVNDVKNYEDVVLYNAAIMLHQESRLKAIKEVLNVHSIVDIDIDLDTLLIYAKADDLMKCYKYIERNIIEGNIENNNESIVVFLRKTGRRSYE